MTLAAIVCCQSSDEMMLPLFMEQWHRIYPHVPLWLANDSIHPVRDTLGLPQTTPVKWGKGVGAGIVRAMLDTGADIVAKVDVDGWHQKAFLFDHAADSNIMATGIAWSREPGRYLGIAYAVRRKALLEMEVGSSCADWRGSSEDTATGNAVRRLYPNGVFLHHSLSCRRADTDPSSALVVHCGIHGRDAVARNLAHAEMLRLRHPIIPETPEMPIWVGLSVMPGRLHSVRRVIHDLLHNTVPITGIVLSAPHKLIRTDQYYDEEELAKIAAIEKVTLLRCEDRGPITKYLGLLSHVEDPQALCLVVDDDITYSPQLIERMIAEWRKFSNAVIANSVMTSAEFPIPEAWAGVFFQRHAFHLPSLEKLLAWINHFPDALLCDDVLIALHLHCAGVSVKKPLAPVFSLRSQANYDAYSLHSTGEGYMPRYRALMKHLRQHQSAWREITSAS